MKTIITIMTFATGEAPSFNGPFPNHGAAVHWGRNWEVQNNDNPCWQALNIPSDFFENKPVLNSPV